MNPKIIVTDFVANVKMYLRSKGTLFWSFAFPVLLILLFGAIFSGGGGSYALYVKNYDYENGVFIAQMMENNTDMGVELGNFTNFYDAVYHMFNSTNITTIRVLGDEDAANEEELHQYIEKHKGKIKALMIIPENYALSLGLAIAQHNASLAENITLMLDPSDTQGNNVILSVVSQFMGQSNLMIAGGDTFVRFNTSSIIQERYEYLDFFIPGVIGLMVMTNSIYGSIERNTKLRKTGILRKLLTTPIKRGEWILAKMLFMLFLAFISTFLILTVGGVVWGVRVHINLYMFALIISGSFAFSGIGMIITRFVKEEETAASAGGAITFPMMFLAGTFFPLEMMPSFLQTIARILPLYYVNEGLRDAMILGNTSGALMNTLIIFIFAAIVFAIGVVITSWKED
ncbi:MAG: hypothetical protein DRN37_11870 [Thermoplasmata archaeon]|nr:MAG: hypothetical protein DRN37_11870 [Thermoplasmata archaeon]